ncbi:hypothetical protein GZH47_02025 [Paenibacillus rhizovicinus]|uniref:Uncharacterized protein n=1 Tax=Paenibacillus rhizovicinus TaxID=2704463 RepID=A0A6C0NU74_9BACL|nr:hypothetical protein [Paenibacillus rhizovicinus]QHW29735.1 hypothetical protein GZH47_02025 [Paenibacillus rhizovicinus]
MTREREERAKIRLRQARRPRLAMSAMNTNNLTVQNPYMPMWWSAAMPGAGHIMVGKIIKGFSLFLWEFVINTQSHLNESICYSMLGRFQEAKDCLDLRWFFMYVTVFIFACWDSYRLTLEVNQLAVLSYREHAPLSAVKLSSIEINYLIKTNPWLGVVWSLFAPGLGHLIARNLFQGLYFLICFIVVVYESRLLESIYFTSIGHFGEATRVLDMEWALFFPSIYGFAVCDVYFRIIEANQLFKLEQTRFLEGHYMDKAFKMPV